ncbi:MAG: aldo/keto reductase, partial [Opitutales bacterium]
GPYGEYGSRKYLLASLDQSLRRMGLDYVDIFYSHRHDPDTPLEETAGALAHAVRTGKALYAGISSYPAVETCRMHALLREHGVALLIHQPRYNLLDRWVEPELLPALAQLGVGCIPFSPLAQGLLTNRYLDGIPADSRAASATGFLRPHDLTPERLAVVRSLHRIAQGRGCTLAQLAVLWLLRRSEVTTVLVGASRVSQLEELHASLSAAPLHPGELAQIESIPGVGR